MNQAKSSECRQKLGGSPRYSLVFLAVFHYFPICSKGLKIHHPWQSLELMPAVFSIEYVEKQQQALAKFCNWQHKMIREKITEVFRYIRNEIKP